MKYRYELLEQVFPQLSNYIYNVDSINRLNGDYTLKALQEINELKSLNSELLKKNTELVNEIDFIKNAKKAAGVEEVFMPGEMEAQMYRRQMREGIPMAAEVVEELIALSRRLGVDIPGTLLSQGRNGKVLVRSMTKVPDILR